MPVQQRIECPRRATAGAVQSGQLVKQTDRIKSMPVGIEEKYYRARAQNSRAQHNAHKKSGRRLRGNFRRNGLWSGVHGLWELSAIDYNVRMAGSQRHQQKYKTGGGKNKPGDSQVATFVKFRTFVDLYQRDDRKNEAGDVERNPAATTKER